LAVDFLDSQHLDLSGGGACDRADLMVFTVADTALEDYMWYVLGLLYVIFLAVRAPKPASTSDSDNVSRSGGDA